MLFLSSYEPRTSPREKWLHAVSVTMKLELMEHQKLNRMWLHTCDATPLFCFFLCFISRCVCLGFYTGLCFTAFSTILNQFSFSALFIRRSSVECTSFRSLLLQFFASFVVHPFYFQNSLSCLCLNHTFVIQKRKKKRNNS